MPETQEAESGTTEQQEQAPPEDAGKQEASQTFDAKYVSDLRAQAAKYRTEAKANAEAAKRLAEIDQASKSELEKLTERTTTAEQRTTAAESKLLRYQVADKAGLPAKWADRLRGDDEEAMLADAKEILADLADKDKSRPPKPDPNQGRGTTAVPLTPGEEFARFVQGRATN